MANAKFVPAANKIYFRRLRGKGNLNTIFYYHKEQSVQEETTQGKPFMREQQDDCYFVILIV